MIDLDARIYERSRPLDSLMEIPKSVAIIGVGGVGSWVAYFFALIGVENLYLIDPDNLETHNLNRTPYWSNQPGMKKVEALGAVIRASRWTKCYLYSQKWENINESAKAGIKSNAQVIVDCRDSTAPLEDLAEYANYITGGYDGLKATIHINPDTSDVFGEDIVRYSITPSYLIPPVVIASTIVNHVCVERKLGGIWFDKYESQIVAIDFNRWSAHLLQGEERFGDDGNNDTQFLRDDDIGSTESAGIPGDE